RHAYTPIATNIESEPFEDPIETEETQPLSHRSVPLSPDYTPASPDYTLDTPHLNEDSKSIEVSETKIASPLGSTSPLSPDHPLTQTSPTSTPLQAFYYHSIARMAVCTQPTLSPNISARVTEAMALSPSLFYEITTPRLPVRATWEDLVDVTVYIDIECVMPPVRAPIQTLTSPEWSSGSLPVSPASLIVPSPAASPETTPSTTIAVEEDEFLEVEAQLELHGILALEVLAVQTDALRTTLSHARYEDQREILALRMQ
ncbi:hypothetical protein Tco_0834921, partial [Tanacetum coccineum]